MNIEYESMRSAMKDTMYSRALTEIRSKIVTEKDATEIFSICLDGVVNAVQAEAGTLWIYEKDNNVILPYAVYGGKDLKGIVLVPGQGIAGKVIETGESVIVDNVNKNKNWSGTTDQKTGFFTDSILCVPIKYRKDTIGCIQLINQKNGNSFEQRDIDLIESLIKYLIESDETNNVLVKVLDQCAEIFKVRVLKSNVDSMNKVFEFNDVNAVVKAVNESDSFVEMDSGKQRKYIYLVKKIWDVFHNRRTLL